MTTKRGVPFTYAEVRPYAVAESLDELRGPVHGCLELPHELAWSGRREFDLDDDYDRVAAYKIVLDEGRHEHFRRYLNGRLLLRHWQEIAPARQVRALWEQRFPSLPVPPDGFAAKAPSPDRPAGNRRAGVRARRRARDRAARHGSPPVLCCWRSARCCRAMHQRVQADHRPATNGNPTRIECGSIRFRAAPLRVIWLTVK